MYQLQLRVRVENMTLTLKTSWDEFIAFPAIIRLRKTRAVPFVLGNAAGLGSLYVIFGAIGNAANSDDALVQLFALWMGFMFLGVLASGIAGNAKLYNNEFDIDNGPIILTIAFWGFASITLKVIMVVHPPLGDVITGFIVSIPLHILGMIAPDVVSWMDDFCEAMKCAASSGK